VANHVWIVEAALTFLMREKYVWEPVLGSTNIPGVYLTRSDARRAARTMFETNRWNKECGHIVCRYRVRKYNAT